MKKEKINKIKNKTSIDLDSPFDLTKNTSVIVQGMTGKLGLFYTEAMKKYGTNIVAGVTPEKGGSIVNGTPIYNTIQEALNKHSSNKLTHAAKKENSVSYNHADGSVQYFV